MYSIYFDKCKKYFTYCMPPPLFWMNKQIFFTYSINGHEITLLQQEVECYITYLKEKFIFRKFDLHLFCVLLI